MSFKSKALQREYMFLWKTRHPQHRKGLPLRLLKTVRILGIKIRLDKVRELLP